MNDFHKLTFLNSGQLLVMFGLLYAVSGQPYPICQEKRSSCSCMTDQGLIDLTPLDSKNGSRFNDIRSTNGVDGYYYNPCTGFTRGTGVNGCNDVTVCQAWPAANPSSYFNYGEPSTAVFQNDETTQKLQIKYTSTTTNPTKTSEITLECNSAVEGTLIFVIENPFNYAKFTLTSKYACPRKGGGGIGVGGVICVIFIAIVLVYIIGGVLFMHFARRSEGIDKIPNITFWRALPGLVKDGVMLVVNPVRAALFGYNKM